ncbi:MAG: hypothetical protein KA354_23070 [Phycisphaerae bacterium]|nr:hypothetical protein [Phycisphaerae bacterium]
MRWPWGTYDKQEINEIANMAVITGRTNRKISNKEPTVYLPDIVAERGEEALTRQGVPLDPAMHRLDNFRGFLEARRQVLADMVNDFIKKALAG